jgi:hypothetical protein
LHSFVGGDKNEERNLVAAGRAPLAITWPTYTRRLRRSSRYVGAPVIEIAGLRADLDAPLVG